MSTTAADNQIEADDTVKRALVIYTKILDAFKANKFGETVLETGDFKKDDPFRIARHNSKLGHIWATVDGIEVEFDIKLVRNTSYGKETIKRFTVDVKGRSGYHHLPVRIFEKQGKIGFNEICDAIASEVNNAKVIKGKDAQGKLRQKEADKFIGPMQTRMNRAASNAFLRSEPNLQGELTYRVEIGHLTQAEVEKLAEFLGVPKE